MRKLSEISVLIVEDDRDIQQIMKKFLEKIVKELHQAFDAESGLDLAINKDPDIIITDLELPNMNGLDMILDLRNKLTYDRPIIVTTSHSGGQYYSSLADEYLYKPVDLQKLLDSMKRLLWAQ